MYAIPQSLFKAIAALPVMDDLLGHGFYCEGQVSAALFPLVETIVDYESVLHPTRIARLDLSTKCILSAACRIQSASSVESMPGSQTSELCPEPPARHFNACSIKSAARSSPRAERILACIPRAALR